MKRRLIETIVCPACKSQLELSTFSDVAGEPEGEPLVREGVLTCHACRTWYPIENYIPVLLDFPVRLHAQFGERHHRHARWPGQLSEPNGRPRPGEEWTQRSFTRQWADLQEDALTFSYTHDQRREFIRIELDWPADFLASRPRTLDIGCGFGLEARLLQDVVRGEVFATDLNLSLIAAGPRYQALPDVHVMVASLFALPFRERSFDLVYCHGVAHHTYSTRKAFETLCRYPGSDGVIYIWVYAHEDFDRGMVRARLGHILELQVRPKLARLPGWLQSAWVYPAAWIHYRNQSRHGSHPGQWRFRNSIHSMRDRWTCRYAYRHSFHEVISWYLEAGLDYRLVDPVAYQKAMGYDLIGIGIRGCRKGGLL